MTNSVDLVIIGAGIVGLATGRALLLRFPRLRVVVVDKEATLGAHQTGRNSGVIHSGLYYKPGSLKAQLCTTGARAMYDYCEHHGIPTNRCGKLVVAVTPEELPRLEELYQRGVANGVAGLQLLGPEAMREHEPNVAGLRAIYSPNTGIVDYSLVAASYARELQQAGGRLQYLTEIQQITQRGSLVRLETTQGPIETRWVVACAGVYADRIAALSGASRDPQIVPFRGDYYVLKPERQHLVRSLIYPVPDPNFPFLGVHTTLRMDGSIWLGPNAVLAFAREGYRGWQVNPADLLEALASPGFQRLARRYWRVGFAEMLRDASKRLFVQSVQRLVPAIQPADVLPGPAGIRAQALYPDGTLVDDFVINQQGAVIHVRNAPSPAATSSLMIGEYLATYVATQYQLAEYV